jgi:hypothetical protein
VAMLNSARTKAAIAMNLRKLKEETFNSKATNSETEDLPPSIGESKPPAVEK